MEVKDFFSSQFYKAAKISFHRANQQAETGVGFDKEAAERLLDFINEEMGKIAAEVEPQLPERPLNKGEIDYWRLPAKPFKKDGGLAATMLKWAEKIGGVIDAESRTVSVDGTTYPITGNGETITTGPMTLANQDHLKDYLQSLGWVPTLWNFKKDSRGKPLRDDKKQLIPTTPKMTEMGKLCPNLEELQGDLVKPIVRWLSLRNRKGVIEGWLNNERLSYDKRLSAGFSGYAPTYRLRHTTVVNVPKAQDDVTLGKEMRSLFCCSRPDYTLVGFDGVALENRVEAHYCYPFHGGKEYAEEILEGDVHKNNSFVFYGPELLEHGWYSPDQVDKENPKLKPFRSRSKNGKYALSYGCSPPKLAKTLGLPEWRGEELYQAFWEANPALTAFRERVTLFWETKGKKKFIQGIDGRKVFTRSKHAIVNTAFQSCGAIVMDYAGLFMDKWLGGIVIDEENYPCYNYKGHSIYRVGYWHDEYLLEVPIHLAEEIGKMGVGSIIKAGEFLKLRVPLDGEAKIGPTWASVH